MNANYSYLSDGTKASVLNASGAGYDYNGTFTYSHASGGARTLESVAFGIALDDFGARRYDRTAWTSIDPLAEKYYSISRYAYCNNNPINTIDVEGDFPLLTNIIGAFVAAGLDYGVQVINNFITGDSYQEAFKNVNLLSIALAGAEVFITSGTSIIKNSMAKQAISAGSELINNTFDVNLIDGALSIEANNLDEVLFRTEIGLMFGMIKNSSFLPSFKKKSITKQVDAARDAFHAQEGRVPKQEAQKMHLKAKEKNQFIDTINQMLTEEQKELFGRLFDDDEE